MIINYKKEKAGVLMIPCMGKDNNNRIVVLKNLRLMPGHNEVDDADWAAARNEVLAKIKSGDLVEIAAEIKEKKPKEGEKQDPNDKRPPQPEVSSKSINKLEAEQAVEIVRDTFDIKTLEKWLKKESRDEVRAEIKTQIDKINAPPVN